MLQLIVHFIPLLLHALGADERKVSQIGLFLLLHTLSVLLLLLRLHVEVGLVDVLHLLPARQPPPLIVRGLQGRQLVEKLFLLLPPQLLLVAGVGHLVPDLAQVVLHQLVVGNLRVVVHFLAEAHHVRQRVLALEKLLIANVTRSLKDPISILGIRICHIKCLAQTFRPKF